MHATTAEHGGCNKLKPGGRVTHSGTGQGVLHNTLHLGLDVVLPEAFLGTAGIQMLGKLGAGPHVTLGPVTCTPHSWTCHTPSVIPSEQPAVHDLAQAGQSQMEDPDVNGHMLSRMVHVYKLTSHLPVTAKDGCGRGCGWGSSDSRAGAYTGVMTQAELAERGFMQKLHICVN